MSRIVRSKVSALLVFAFAAVGVAGAAADSNEARARIPQLSADTNAWAELQRLRETNQPAVPQVSLVEMPTPAEPQPRHPGLMILAVLAVLAGSYLLQRWRSRPDAP